jgi:putative ABC transport system substrate-binding protein
MNRRKFITLLGGAAVWPMAARGQQGERIRDIGVFMDLAADDAEGQARAGAFLQGLQKTGWALGRNLRVEYRWVGGDPNRLRRYAAELLALRLEAIFAAGTPTVSAMQPATSNVPIVFASVADPVGAGFVRSLARPGGNVTGFTPFEYSISGKWLELLKQIAPGVTRAAILRDASSTSGIGQFAAIQAVASTLGIEVQPIGVRDVDEIDRGVTAFANAPNGGLIVTGGPPTALRREGIIALARRHRLPTVYPYRFHAAAGGLISYGPDVLDQYRRAAGYVDRILKGEQPANLPVQAPTKFELVINLKTAKALGLTVPDTVLARADEVIE